MPHLRQLALDEFQGRHLIFKVTGYLLSLQPIQKGVGVGFAQSSPDEQHPDIASGYVRAKQGAHSDDQAKTDFTAVSWRP
jgi:hypothetical protein